VGKYGTAGQVTEDNIIGRMRFACWIVKSTDTHSEFVIRIALSRQQWLRERPSILRNMYNACLVRYYSSLMCTTAMVGTKKNLLEGRPWKMLIFKSEK